MVRLIYNIIGGRARKRPRKIMSAIKCTIQIIAIVVFAHVLPVHAQNDSNYVDEELAAASRSVNEGHVKEGYDRLVALLRQIDPTNDKDNYWRISATLVEFLFEIEDHPQ